MELKDLKTPSVSEYEAAFRDLASLITDKQREMLCVHHSAPARVISATRLAREVGFQDYTAANLQYGLLARKIEERLDLPERKAVRVGAIADFVPPDYVANEHYLWVMRENVAHALENLGWVPRLSSLFYPRDALKTNS